MAPSAGVQGAFRQWFRQCSQTKGLILGRCCAEQGFGLDDPGGSWWVSQIPQMCAICTRHTWVLLHAGELGAEVIIPISSVLHHGKVQTCQMQCRAPGTGLSHSAAATVGSGGWRKGSRAQMKTEAERIYGYRSQSRNCDHCNKSEAIFIIIMSAEIRFNAKIPVINVLQISMI